MTALDQLTRYWVEGDLRDWDTREVVVGQLAGEYVGPVVRLDEVRQLLSPTPPTSNLVTRLRDLSNRLRDSGRYTADECDLAAASLIDEAIAALPAETTAESVSLDYQLPCDVRLPPAATIGKGCLLRTLMHALRVREKEPVEFVDERSMAVRRAITQLHRPQENVTTVSNEREYATYVTSPQKATGERCGPTEPDNDLVICPACTSQFRAIPVNVQQAINLERQRLVSLADRWNKKGRWEEADEVYARINAIDLAMNARGAVKTTEPPTVKDSLTVDPRETP